MLSKQNADLRGGTTSPSSTITRTLSGKLEMTTETHASRFAVPQP